MESYYVLSSENLIQVVTIRSADVFRSLQKLTGTKSYHGPFRVKWMGFNTQSFDTASVQFELKLLHNK